MVNLLINQLSYPPPCMKLTNANQREVCATIDDHGRRCLCWMFDSRLGMSHLNSSQRSSILSQKKTTCEAEADKTENPGQKKEETRGVVWKLRFAASRGFSSFPSFLRPPQKKRDGLIHDFQTTSSLPRGHIMTPRSSLGSSPATDRSTNGTAAEIRSARAEARHGSHACSGSVLMLDAEVLRRFLDPTAANFKLKNISDLSFFSTSFGSGVALNHHHHHHHHHYHHHHRRNIQGKTCI